MPVIRLNQQVKRVEVQSFEVENQIVFEFFNSVPAADRDDAMLRALYMGVLALKEDRLAAFLSRTANELGTELESLKMLFDMKQELFFKSAVKGAAAEIEIADALNNYFESKGLKDEAILTGNASGTITRNKTGDIICTINGSDDLRVAIECKFDKSIRLGDIDTKDLFGRRSDSIWSQLLEAQANRDGAISIIALDASLIDGAVQKQIDNVGYIPKIGFVAVVDSQKGSYSNLFIAYMLARDIAVNAQTPDIDFDLLALLIRRIVKDLNSALSVERLIKTNIQNNQKILEELNKSLLSIEFTLEAFTRLLKKGTLTNAELFEYFTGDEVRKKYAPIEDDIKSLADDRL